MVPVDFGKLMLAILVATAVAACWNDYRHHRVPNWLTGGVLACAFVAQGWFNGWRGLEQGLAGMVVGAAPLLVLWSLRGMGAGDVKFMAGVGAWLGPELALRALVVGGLAGGVMAVAVIAARGAWRQSGANIGLVMAKMSSGGTAFGEFASAQSLSGSTGALPYAIPLSVGTLWVCLSSHYGWWGVL